MRLPCSYKTCVVYPPKLPSLSVIKILDFYEPYGILNTEWKWNQIYTNYLKGICCNKSSGDTAISVIPAKNSSKYVPDYTLELLDGVSHWVQEQEPERVNKLIENFIK